MIALGGAYNHVFVSMLILGVLYTFCSPALAGLMPPVYVKSNSGYAALIPVDGTPLSFTKDNKSVPKGSPSNHCIEGNPCWELLSDRWFAELQSDNVSGNGTILVTPIDRKKSPTEILVRDRNGTSGSLPKPKGVGQTEVLELDPNRKSSTVILYNEEVKDTKVNGSIKIRNETRGLSGVRLLTVPYLSKLYEGKCVVLLTGYFGNSNEIITGELAGNRAVLIPVFPDQDAPDYKTLRVSFQNACAVNTWNVMVYVLSLIVIKANA
ncbi:hypothetical protein SprV_0802479500 [Sparganum proliferum]